MRFKFGTTGQLEESNLTRLKNRENKNPLLSFSCQWEICAWMVAPLLNVNF